MVRHLVLALTAVLVVSPGIAHADEDWNEVVFEASAPGTVLTPYWLGDNLCIGCNPDGQVRSITRAVGYDRPLFNPRTVTELCDRPFPPGSFDEEVLGEPVVEASGLVAEIRPTVDWDFVICSMRGPSSAEIRGDPSDTGVRWRLEAFGRCPALCGPDQCPTPLWVGCVESASTSVADRPYKLVAYNWIDPMPCPGRWRWL